MKVVSINPTTNAITVDENGTQAEKQVDAAVKVTLNNKPAKIGDLRAGDTVSIAGDPATSVSATR